VLLSAEATVRPADIYVVCIEPESETQADQPDQTIFQSLAFSRIGGSAFDQDWNSPKEGHFPGSAPMQLRFKAVAAFLGLAYAAIPVSNLVFTQPGNIGVRDEQHEDHETCVAVHRMFVDEIRPKKLWIMGNADDASILLTDEHIEWRDTRDNDGSVGHGTAVICGHPVELCVTPHLGIWDPTGEDDALRFAFGI